MSPHTEILMEIHQSQRDHELSIIRISDPIASTLTNDVSTSSNIPNRASDVSVSQLEAPTPSSLEADLIHYKELFSKLRFSYVEQVTKEKFIRSIVSDPPLVISHSENAALESQLSLAKAELKAQKTHVADVVQELEVLGRELVRKYESVKQQTTQLETLPEKIEGLEISIKLLHAKQKAAGEENPLLNMTLEQTQAAIREKGKESKELDKELERLQAALPKRTRDVERSDAELQPLEVKRLGSLAGAREAKRRKEAMLGGAGDDLEERGRWWTGVERSLKGMLEV